MNYRTSNGWSFNFRILWEPFFWKKTTYIVSSINQQVMTFSTRKCPWVQYYNYQLQTERWSFWKTMLFDFWLSLLFCCVHLTDTLPKTNIIARPWKRMFGKRSFPFWETLSEVGSLTFQGGQYTQLPKRINLSGFQSTPSMFFSPCILGRAVLNFRDVKV